MQNCVGSWRSKWKENYLVIKFKESRCIAFFALILALMCTFISYPGIWYSDSYSRVDFANVIIRDIGLLATGRGSIEPSKSWLTVIPSFFMAISKFFTGNVLAYTFAQSFAFLFVTFLLIRKLNNNCKILQYLLFGLCPLIVCVSVYYEAGIGCVTGISTLVLLFSSSHEEEIGSGGVLAYSL